MATIFPVLRNVFSFFCHRIKSRCTLFGMKHTLLTIDSLIKRFLTNMTVRLNCMLIICRAVIETLFLSTRLETADYWIREVGKWNYLPCLLSLQFYCALYKRICSEMTQCNFWQVISRVLNLIRALHFVRFRVLVLVRSFLYLWELFVAAPVVLKI